MRRNDLTKLAIGVSFIGVSAALMGAGEPPPRTEPSKAGAPAPAINGRDDAVELDARRCKDSCNECIWRCRQSQAGFRCDENCRDMNHTCCEANGKKGVNMSCGCL